VSAAPESTIVLDAGSGIHRIGRFPNGRRVDLLLSHLHMDHILGLGFFAALFQPELEVHIWGPGAGSADLHNQLTRYLSPPLFPVRLDELPARPQLHGVLGGAFDLPGARVVANLVCHPGATLGFRIEADDCTLAYIPDHEPALAVPAGGSDTPSSGLGLAHHADLLIHDAQYTEAEYPDHVGWGHSSIRHALELAERAAVRRLMPFHHDPAHDDDELDLLYARVRNERPWPFEITPAMEGAVVELGL
jgi:ribonuclease BN (tRNA processing enzyme)